MTSTTTFTMSECPSPVLPHRPGSAPITSHRAVAPRHYDTAGRMLAQRSSAKDVAEMVPGHSDGPGKQSDFEVVGVDEDTASDTDSTVSVEESLSPLPPLPTFNSSATPAMRNATPNSSSLTIDHKAQLQAIKQSREIALPIQRAPPPEPPRGKHNQLSPQRQTSDASDNDQGTSSTPPPSKTPEPLPKIHIPKIPSIPAGISPPLNLPALAAGLEGNYVDEFGNILDWNGHVLGRVEGDLPAMVGRPVSASGEVLSSDGQVVGYVVENETLPALRPLEGVAGEGLQVDGEGKILDSSGNVVGRLDGKSETSPLPHGPAEESTGTPPQRQPSPKRDACSCGQPKPSSAPSPSEIFLDVKSTNDGIQLIIKIPTVFNREEPAVHTVS